MRFLLLCCTLLFIAACTDTNKADIQHLLDERDHTISTQNINNYASLLSPTYLKGEGQSAVNQMQQIFSRFEQVEMHSQQREIRISDDDKAMCEQTYSLKVFADGHWREIVQREQIQLGKIENKWFIVGGL